MGTIGKKKKVKYKWLKEIDEIIANKRKLLSQCVAEIERLKQNKRITKKSRRNREEFAKMVGVISIHSLTKLACKLKAEIRRSGKIRKKKMKNQEARDLNNSFRNNQGKVFRIFREIIDSDKDCEAPVFKKIEKERKFFVDADPVINF